MAPVTAGKYSFKIMVPKTIRDADLKVNVPKIKYSMEPIKLTCALKNIFGCNPHPQKFKYHSKLGEAIVAINKAMKFNLHIIDGIVVSGIQPRRLGLVMGKYRIISAARKNHVKLMIGYPLRFNPAFCKVKERIDYGTLGDIEIAHAAYISTGPFMHRAEAHTPLPVPEW